MLVYGVLHIFMNIYKPTHKTYSRGNRFSLLAAFYSCGKSWGCTCWLCDETLPTICDETLPTIYDETLPTIYDENLRKTTS